MEEVRKAIKMAVKRIFDVEVEPEVVVAGKKLKNGKVADYASNMALKLSKMVGKRPMEVAEEIKKELGDVAKYEVEATEPGFLNFIARDEYLIEEMGKFGGDFEKNISPDEYISWGEYSGKRVICEFSDPNPFKVLHVGHLYTSIVGESISRLIEMAGAKVVRANFGGDVGLHVAKTMYVMLQKSEEFNDEMTLTEKAEKMAECYVSGTRAYEEDEEAHKEIVRLNKEIFEIVNQGVNGEKGAENCEEGTEGCGEKEKICREKDVRLEKIERLYFWGRKASYEYFEDFYKKMGVKFDVYYPESTVAGKGLLKVKEGLQKGVYKESDGAVVFEGEKYGLHTRVFVNKAGLPTYEAKDVGLIFQKWEDYEFDKSIVITGNDIIDYMKVVLKSIEQYAPKLVERTLHLTHGNVRLPGNEKMSSRKGNFLGAVEVLDLVRDALEKEYSNKDEKVVMGAVKYAFLKYKVGGNIVFDVKDSVSMTGNSGPYLQYAVVRAGKVLGNLMKNGVKEGEDWKMNEQEKMLIKKIIQYKEILEEAVAGLAPYKICGYLYELSQEFSRFYEKVQVAGSDYERQRGEMVLGYLKVMTHGLGLLGIEVPERM